MVWTINISRHQNGIAIYLVKFRRKTCRLCDGDWRRASVKTFGVLTWFLIGQKKSGSLRDCLRRLPEIILFSCLLDRVFFSHLFKFKKCQQWSRVGERKGVTVKYSRWAYIQDEQILPAIIIINEETRNEKFGEWSTSRHQSGICLTNTDTFDISTAFAFQWKQCDVTT